MADNHNNIIEKAFFVSLADVSVSYFTLSLCLLLRVVVDVALSSQVVVGVALPY